MASEVNCIALPDFTVRTIVDRLTTEDVDKLWIFTFNKQTVDDVDQSLYRFNLSLDKSDSDCWETLTFGNDSRAWIELLYSIQRFDLLKLVDSSSTIAESQFKTHSHYPLVCRLLLKVYNLMDREREHLFRTDVDSRMRTTSDWIRTRVDGDLRDYSLGCLLRLLFTDKRGVSELYHIFRARSDSIDDEDDWSVECADSVHLYLHGQQYPIDKDPAGLCFIVNIKYFNSTSHPERIGSDHDLKNLQSLFTDLGFLVRRSSPWASYQMLKSELLKISNEDHSKYCAFVCILMSHGENGKVICSDGQPIDVQHEVVQQFNKVNCPSLERKPKLFFIQACRSNTYHVGTDSSTANVTLKNNTASNEETKVLTKASLLNLNETHDEADFLVSYATVEGYDALRFRNGSPYITKLVEHLRKSASKEGINEILTKVNVEASNVFQQPIFSSTLGKKLRFNEPRK